MAVCGRCGRAINFIKGAGSKSLVVNKNPVSFIPDSYGDRYFIYNGVMRKGRIASDGLKGHTIHKCEEI